VLLTAVGIFALILAAIITGVLNAHARGGDSLPDNQERAAMMVHYINRQDASLYDGMR
jgi:hypothetical protein